MKYFSTDLGGVTLIEPDASRMRQILDTVANCTEDYPEVFLTHSSGITISYRNGGILIREENEEVTGTLAGIHVEAALEAWQLLASNNLEELDGLPWNKPA